MSVHWGAMSVAMLTAMRLQRTNIGTDIAWKLTDVATDMAEHCETDHPLPANIATDTGKCVSDVATDVGLTMYIATDIAESTSGTGLANRTVSY